MSYARWAKNNEITSFLKKNIIGSNDVYGGVPVLYDGNKCYVSDENAHSLVIGSTGSGKTQAMIYPSLKFSLLKGESVIVNDVKGEIYKTVANNFLEKGYKNIVIDFDNSVYGNYYNPLSMPFNLYKEGNVDKALLLVENIGYYLFNDSSLKDADSFWKNSVIDFFTGLCIYSFQEDYEPSLNDVFELGNKFNDNDFCSKFLKEIEINSVVYSNVIGTAGAPYETRGGIISTFNQLMKKFVSRKNLTEMMSRSDFDISKIAMEKTAVFIISGYNENGNNLIPLFVNQVFEVVNIYGNNDRYVSILLDEFDRLLPIYNFDRIINYSRSLGIRFTVVIKSYMDLINTYGREQAEIIKYCFANIIFLLSNDIGTLEEISKLCGNTLDGKSLVPLISVEELKCLDRFEAIVLIPRIMPIRTKLIPDYKLDWNLSKVLLELQNRK